MKKIASILALISIIGSMFSTILVGYGWTSGDILEVSDGSLEWTRYTIPDSGGYLIPSNDTGDWLNSTSAWRHPTWKRVDNIKTLYDAGADWVWRINKVAGEEAKTGSVVFFKKKIVLPYGAVVTPDWSLKITADNAYYLYISHDGPQWSGEPLVSDGFTGSFTDFYDVIDGYAYPKIGAIDTSASVVRSVESLDYISLAEHLKPGENWLTIVAVNAQPEPTDKQTSSNTAGLIYVLEGAWDFSLDIPPGFMIQLDSAPPETIEPTTVMDPMTIYPIQAVYNSDYNDDNITDIVLGKPMAVQVRVEDPSITDIKIGFEGTEIIDGSPVDNIFSCYPFTPTQTGEINITGSYSTDSGVTWTPLTNATIKVSGTSGLDIAYSYLDGSGLRNGYGDISEADYNLMVGESTRFINSTYPIAGINADQTYYGIAGAAKAKKNDPYRSLLDDSIAAANEAQSRLGGSAFGVAIAPDETQTGKDYFDYQGFAGAAGISFGPSVKGVIVLDDYISAAAHEMGHAHGLYYGTPEQYYTDPPYGKEAYGVDLQESISLTYAHWRSGICFMGAAPNDAMEGSWVSKYVWDLLFEALLDPVVDPQVLLASGVIWTGGEYEGLVELGQWVKLSDGYVDNLDPNGAYALVFYDSSGEIGRVSFDAPSTVTIEPAEGTAGNITDYGDKPSNFGAFSFATELPMGTEYIQLIRNSDPINPLATVYDYELIYVKTWMSNSQSNNITQIGTHFTYDNQNDNYKLQNSNAGSLKYHIIVDPRGSENTTLQIELPYAEFHYGDPNNPVYEPAFDFLSGSYISVYTDITRTEEITDSVEWNYSLEENTVYITLDTPEGSKPYVILHLDYAVEFDQGWEFETDPSEYQQELPIHAEYDYYDPMLERSMTARTVTSFKAVGIW